MKIKELSQQWRQDIEVNGKQIEVRVTIEVSYDECFYLSDFEEQEQDQQLLAKKIDNYELAPVFIQVLGHIDGHLFGIDSIGGVLMSGKQDIDITVKECDMVNNCLEDVKTNLISFLKKVG